MTITLDRRVFGQASGLRSRYLSDPVPDDPAMSSVVTEFVRLSLSMNAAFGRFHYASAAVDSTAITTAVLAADFRFLIDFRDTLRSTGSAGDIVSVLSSSIKRIAFRFAKASASSTEVADFFDVAGWNQYD